MAVSSEMQLGELDSSNRNRMGAEGRVRALREVEDRRKGKSLQRGKAQSIVVTHEESISYLGGNRVTVT